MKALVQTFSIFVLFFWMHSAPAQTTLVAGTGTAVLDGDIGEWTSTPLMTQRNVELRAMADGEYLYLAATWPDATNDVHKGRWEFDGANWTKGAGDEDRIMFIWDIGLSGNDGASCQAFCHAPVMRTNEGFVDVWHWKSARSNPVGFIDDKYWDTVDRQSDSGTTSYVDNTDGALPTHMASGDPNANVDFLAIDAGALALFDPFQAIAAHTVAEAVAFDANAGFTAGARIPFYLLRPAAGDRGSVESAGRWDNGMWTVEFRKPYAAGSDTTDFAVRPGEAIEFSHEIFDNVTSHGNHAFEAAAGTGSADFTVYTLDLSQIPLGVGVDSDDFEIPEVFHLGANYPNPFSPTTTISFDVPETALVELRVYNVLGQVVETIMEKELSAGKHTVRFSADALASGVYFYSLRAGGYVETRRMVVVR